MSIQQFLLDTTAAINWGCSQLNMSSVLVILRCIPIVGALNTCLVDTSDPLHWTEATHLRHPKWIRR